MKLRTMGRALVVLVCLGAVLGAVAPVGAAAPSPRSAVGVASGKAFRAGWYEDITGECDNIRDAAVGLFGIGTGGSGGISYSAGVGLLGRATAPAAGAGATGFLGTFGAGSALVTGGQLLAVAAVGTTAFCTGLLGAQWITGNSPYNAPVYNGPFFTFNEHGAIPCQQITGMTPVFSFSMCQRFSPPGASFNILRLNQYGETIETSFYNDMANTALHFGAPPNFTRTYDPSIYRGSYVQTAEQGQQITVEVNCRTADICVFEPSSYNSWQGVSIGGGATLPFTGIGSMPNPQRLNARAYCQSPAGSTQLFSSSGPWSNGVDAATNPDSVLCPAGWLRMTYNLDLQTLSQQYRTSESLVSMPDLAQVPVGGESLISWVIPAFVQSNPVLRQCYLDGFTNCEATSADGVTTVVNNVTNQTTNVNVPGPQTTLTEVLQPVRDAIESVVTTPTTAPNPTTVPTTVPNPTTVPTTVPPTTPTTVPCSGIACQSSDPEPPENDTDGCFSTGYSWNPVSWVLVPIKCSFTWLFVPSGSAWDEVTADLDGLSDSPPLSWVVGGSQLLTGSSVQFVRWADADLPSFTVQGYTFDFASLDGAEAPTGVKVMLIIALWILLAYCVVRFL